MNKGESTAEESINFALLKNPSASSKFSIVLSQANDGKTEDDGAESLHIFG